MSGEALRDEERRLRRLRFIMDLTQAVLMQSELDFREVRELLENARAAALVLFPDKEEVYDLVYASRFKRILADRFVISGGKP